MPTFLCGHGLWNLKDGFTRVLANNQVTFYTKNSKTLWMQQDYRILSGTVEFSDKDIDVYGPSTSVPDMTLSHVTPAQRAEFEASAKRRQGPYKLIFADPGHPKKLSGIMAALPGEGLIWLACREVAFKKVIRGANDLIGARIGVNVRENPTTYYSAFIANTDNPPNVPGVPGPARINYVDRGTWRGFMPPSWNI